MSLEIEYIVKLGDVETTMLLPSTLVEGTILKPKLTFVELEDPPVIEKPITLGAVYRQDGDHWDLRIELEVDKPFMKFQLKSDLLSVPETSATFTWTDPCMITVNNGKVEIVSSSDVLVKMNMDLEELKGSFTAIRRDPDTNLWILERDK